MAISEKDEKALLNQQEWEVVVATRHPVLQDCSAQELQTIRKRLREMHAKEQGFVRHKRRVGKGTADTRGGSFPGTEERPTRRKQAFAQAMRRVNSEIDRRNSRLLREASISARQEALARKRAAASTRPANTRTASKGPSRVENRRSQSHVPGSKIGSVTKQTARHQGRKDS